LLPRSRVAECALEYQQVRRAFVETIMPHIDRDLMRQVLERKWLRPSDGSH